MLSLYETETKVYAFIYKHYKPARSILAQKARVCDVVLGYSDYSFIPPTHARYLSRDCKGWRPASVVGGTDGTARTSNRSSPNRSNACPSHISQLLVRCHWILLTIREKTKRSGRVYSRQAVSPEELVPSLLASSPVA